MSVARVIPWLDRWGTLLLVYLLPFQTRIIFEHGVLAGAPSEAGTVSLHLTTALVLALVAVRLARRAGDGRVMRSKTALLFGVLVIVALLSLIVSVAPRATLIATAHLIVGGAVLYLIATAPSGREVRLAFVISACVQAAIAVGQFMVGRVYPSTVLGIAAHYPEVPGTSVVEAAGMRLLRAYGTLPHPNILGGMLALALLAARGLFARSRAASLGTSALLTVGLFLTFSRVAWLALAAGFIAHWLVNRRVQSAARLPLFIATLVLMLSAAFAPFVAARVGMSGRLEARSLTARTSSIEDGAALIAAHPLEGVGMGASTIAIHVREPLRPGYGIEPPHSAPLAAWAELGILGLTLLVLILVRLGKAALGAGNIGLIAALGVVVLLDHWAWTTYGGILIFWAGWGMALRRT